MLVVDSVVLISILLMSISIRFGHWFFPIDNFAILVIFGAPLLAIPIFYCFGLYRAVIRYVEFRVLWTIIQAVTLYALVWGLFTFMIAVDGIPRSVIIINWIFSILIIGGLRMLARWSLTTEKSFYSNKQFNKKRVMIYGAGDAGIQLVGALSHSNQYSPVGFFDDAKELQGTNIWGLSVYSGDLIGEIIKKFKVDEVLIAMPTASRARRSDIVKLLVPFQVQVRMLPNVSDIAGGKVSVDDLHVVSIEDLLGRNSTLVNQKLLNKNIKGKTVLITGAGGSIGSELSRQIVLLKPKKLILFEMSELGLYKIEMDLIALRKNQIKIYPVLGSVNNTLRLNKVLKHFKVDTIYHAAAYKHVPMVEFNNAEGVDNNIFGTLNCAKAAINNGIKTFVLISTDKAVRPTNTMGATKRCAELILQALSDTQSITKFTMVRFGNVLDSSGSVIPLFKKQISDGGPVTVTHKNIIRFFMTISEAVELVIQAGAMGTGGDVFILDMGKPVGIDDLAKKMIRLSGLSVRDEYHPDGDIEIKYVGLRPGEKLYEELLVGDMSFKTKNPLIMRAKEEMISWNDLKPLLDRLKKEVMDCDQIKIRKLLIKLVPGFKPNTKINDILYKKSN